MATQKLMKHLEIYLGYGIRGIFKQKRAINVCGIHYKKPSMQGATRKSIKEIREKMEGILL